MDPVELKVSVGDRVIISRPSSNQPYAPLIERVSSVTAVRPKSFDAGGLCFRNDGREWNGHNRVRTVLSEDVKENMISQIGVEDATRAERATEDAMLAFLLSSRHQKEWLKLGLVELRRIAGLHGLSARNPRPAPAFDADSED